MNHTRKIIGLLAVVAVSAIGLSACKEFLEAAPQGQIEESAIRNDPAAAQNLVTGVYNTMWDGSMHGFDYVGMTDIASDDADKGSSATDGANTYGTFDNLNPTPGVGNLNNVWSAYFRAIAKANQALALIPLSPANQTTRNQLEGEVRFLRGYFYFNLVRFFGGVPLITSVPPVEDINNTALQTRASKQAVYDFIISELRYAVTNLPIKSQTQTGAQPKPLRWACWLRCICIKKSWQQAYNLTDSIIKIRRVRMIYYLPMPISGEK